MKKIVGSIFFSVFFLTGAHIRASVPPSLKISIAIPRASFDISDLDVRDQFNRPVRTVDSKSSFENLWQNGLNQEILNSLTPARIRLLALLHSTWDHFSSRMAAPIKKFFRQAATYLQMRPQSWRFNLSQFYGASVPQLVVLLQSLHNEFHGSLLELTISSTRLLR